MSQLEELEQLERDFEDAKGAIARAEGRLDSAMNSLKTLNFNSIEEAEQAAEDLQEEIADTMSALQKRTDKFMEKYSDLFTED